MKKSIPVIWLFILCSSFLRPAEETAWIRINQLGYTPAGIKVAVWCSKQTVSLSSFELVDAGTQKTVYTHTAGKSFGAYGPFTQTYRLDFSGFRVSGNYFLRAGQTQSPVFRISQDVYYGSADFCLRYMRQQRSGFNPFLNDSCHTHDGYTLYGPMPDSSYQEVSGGWHDASDYLQYSTTSANATYHLLAAYRDFPKVFGDEKQANGLDGKNGQADVLDEAKWGLQWLLKMHPRANWLFNQLGDDRDHMGMRIPKEDSFYGRGFQRPVYFVSGKPQQRGKFMNATTGGASTAGKFASAFALGADLYRQTDKYFSGQLEEKALSAYRYGLKLPGVAQTVSVRSPYIYAEDNWVDDMELGGVSVYNMLAKNRSNLFEANKNRLAEAFAYAKQEPLTPWLGADTAKHYQWYPFINVGHYELAKTLQGSEKNTVINWYRQGIEKVWAIAQQNAFYRGIPFIWCSNNLTTSFATQCYWYEQLSGSDEYAAFAQANIDWLFGCNPWGTTMVYGLPAWGDTPVDPHSAFTHLKNYPIDGGLVDGPVYTSIYKSLIGITLKDADEYADFQSNLAVYHDDYGDYSTNEPTMDGTASLIYLLAAKEAEAAKQSIQGAVVRGNPHKKEMALVFTGDEFGDGLNSIENTLLKNKTPGSFFFTGRFYRTPAFRQSIQRLAKQGHLLGPHSNGHLLYCDWAKRDSLLVTRDSLFTDLQENEKAMQALGIPAGSYFIPPYEWWNTAIGKWMKESGKHLFSFTPGTGSNADYTWPEMGQAYKTSDEIFANIKKIDETNENGLNGVVLLIHIGTDPRRKDKFYQKLDALIGYLKGRGYALKRVDELLK